MRLQLSRALAALLGVIGVVLIVETAFVGGVAGYVVGAFFLLAGAGRLYLSFR